MSGLAGAVGAVVQGRRGRLFLGRQDGFDLGRFTDGSALPPSLLAQWRATLIRRGEALSARGIPYVFMIAPDAPSVHFEDLPQNTRGPIARLAAFSSMLWATFPVYVSYTLSTRCAVREGAWMFINLPTRIGRRSGVALPIVNSCVHLPKSSHVTWFRRQPRASRSGTVSEIWDRNANRSNARKSRLRSSMDQNLSASSNALVLNARQPRSRICKAPLPGESLLSAIPL